MKTKERVINYGEVYTPEHLVRAMVDLVDEEVRRIDARVLEPACGNGNFLVDILRRKLETAQRAGITEGVVITAVSSLYGIDILADNVEECRHRLATVVAEVIGYTPAAVRGILRRNIIHGDTLTGLAGDGTPIIITEWVLEGDDRIAWREFVFADLATKPRPVREHSPIPLTELARALGEVCDEH
jgi:hypothetical protein